MRRNMFLLLVTLLCSQHFVLANNNEIEELNTKISCSIENLSKKELLKATSSLGAIEKLDLKTWVNHLKKAELNYDTIWQKQRFWYRIIKGISLYFIYSAFYGYVLLKNDNLKPEELIGIRMLLLIGWFGILKSWKCDRAYDIVNIIKKRIEILQYDNKLLNKPDTTVRPCF